MHCSSRFYSDACRIALHAITNPVSYLTQTLKLNLIPRDTSPKCHMSVAQVLLAAIYATPVHLDTPLGCANSYGPLKSAWIGEHLRGKGAQQFVQTRLGDALFAYMVGFFIHQRTRNYVSPDMCPAS
jgi:uncharacterized membrane protein YGL010W